MEVVQNFLNTIAPYEGQILLFVQNHLREEWLTPILVTIGKLGNAGAVWIVLAVLLLFRKETRKTGILAALALIGSLCVTNFLLKNQVARIRPYEVIQGLEILISKPKEFSFPSGHASASFAAAMVFFKNRPKRFGVPCMILAFLIAFSRVYVGVHYPTDIIGGIIIGSILGLIVFWLFGDPEYKRKARRERKEKQRRRK